MVDRQKGRPFKFLEKTRKLDAQLKHNTMSGLQQALQEREKRYTNGYEKR